MAPKKATARSKSLATPPPDVAMLVTSATAGVRDCGTAFCVESDPAGASVVTCAHVVSDVDASQDNLRVNGEAALAITSADDRGIDLAILKIPGQAGRRLTRSSRAPQVGIPFTGLGYIHLHGGHYVTRPLKGTVKQVMMMRAQHSRSGVSSLLLSADEDTTFEPGNSGSAICDEREEVIGVLAFASRDGRQGYAIAIDALDTILPRKASVVAMTADRDLSDVTSRPLPPALKEVTVVDDPQKGRFGGVPTDGHVAITARLRRVSRSYFRFDVSVQAVRSGLKLLPPARFYLHDTYPRPVIQITKYNEEKGFTLSEVDSYGVYTIGCQVFASDGQWHRVEYDLVNLPDLPAEFANK